MLLEPENEPEEKKASYPPRKELKNGFIFNPSKSENIVREILFEFDSVFEGTYLDIMCQVVSA